MSTSQINTLTLYKTSTTLPLVSQPINRLVAWALSRHSVMDKKTAEELRRLSMQILGGWLLLLDVLVGLMIVERYQDDYALSQMVQLLTAHDIDLGESRLRKLDSYIKATDDIEDLRDTYRQRITSTQWQVSPPPCRSQSSYS